MDPCTASLPSEGRAQGTDRRPDSSLRLSLGERINGARKKRVTGAEGTEYLETHF